MKKLIVIVLVSLFCFAGTAFSEDTENQKISKDTEKQTVCKQIDRVAEMIMKARQANIPMSELMEVMKIRSAFVILVRMAYKEPRFTTKEHQENAITDFRNLAFSMCLEQRMENE